MNSIFFLFFFKVENWLHDNALIYFDTVKKKIIHHTVGNRLVFILAHSQYY